MKWIYAASALLGLLVLISPTGGQEAPAVQLEPETNELLQPDWPEPCMDGETVDDPFCDGGTEEDGGGGTTDCSTCQYCGMERDGLQLIPTCKQTAYEDPGNTCCDDSSGTSCIVSGSTCWRI